MALEGEAPFAGRSLEALPLRVKLEANRERGGASGARPFGGARGRDPERAGGLKRNGTPRGACEGGRGEGAGAWTGWRREGRARPA